MPLLSKALTGVLVIASLIIAAIVIIQRPPEKSGQHFDLPFEQKYHIARDPSGVVFDGEVRVAVYEGIPSVHSWQEYGDNTVWYLTATVIGQSLPAKRPLLFRILDLKNKRYLSEWAPLDYEIGTRTIEVVNVGLSDSAALNTIKAYPHVAVEFTSNGATPERRLTVQYYCENFPLNFEDEITLKRGCSHPSLMCDGKAAATAESVVADF